MHRPVCVWSLASLNRCLFLSINHKTGTCHEGKKPQMCVFLNDDRLFTTGFSRMSERQLALWNSDDLENCLWRQELDITNGILFPFYDPDTELIFICGKVRSLILFLTHCAA